ncbi:hypothetical protein NMY22_g16481 [Coprinellus aureogranulatus]|nr:hypothetical protein NMY22_g16481 [Coprinellus aureogranulatus]
MTRTGWASKEEWEYLTSLMPKYEACQVRRRYKPFWQRVNAEFLTKFPVIKKLFPGRKVTDLLPEEKEMYTSAVARQQQKDLRNIYHGRTRVLKPYETFAKLYPAEVEMEKKSRCAALGISGRDTLTVWHEAAKDLYSAATPEQLEAVKVRLAGDREGGDDSGDEDQGHDYSRLLHAKAPSILNAAITPAVRKAGVLAFLTVVGPSPEQNGKIICKSFQFGDKAETPVFSQVWEGHDTIFVEELARFARRHEFPPEVCAARSANGTKAVVKTGSPEPSKEREGIVGPPPASTSMEEHGGGASHPQAPTGAPNLSRSDAPAVGAPPELNAAIAVNVNPGSSALPPGPQPSFSVSTTVLHNKPLINASEGDQQVQGSDRPSLGFGDGGPRADPGPLFLRDANFDEEFDEDNSFDSIEQWNFTPAQHPAAKEKPAIGPSANTNRAPADTNTPTPTAGTSTPACPDQTTNTLNTKNYLAAKEKRAATTIEGRAQLHQREEKKLADEEPPIRRAPPPGTPAVEPLGNHPIKGLLSQAVSRAASRAPTRPGTPLTESEPSQKAESVQSPSPIVINPSPKEPLPIDMADIAGLLTKMVTLVTALTAQKNAATTNKSAVQRPAPSKSGTNNARRYLQYFTL